MGRTRRWAKAYWAWPRWAKIAAPTAVVVVLAVSGGKKDPADANSVKPEPSTSIAATMNASRTTTRAPVVSVVSTTSPGLPVATTSAVATSVAAPTVAPTSPPAASAPQAAPAAAPQAPPVETSPPQPATTAAPVNIRPLADVPAVDKFQDPRFSTCKKAKTAGYGPYFRDKDVEYGWYTDRDHDGIVCE